MENAITQPRAPKIPKLTSHTPGHLNFAHIYVSIEAAELDQFDGKAHKPAAKMGISPQAYCTRKARILEGKVNIKTILEFEELFQIKLICNYSKEAIYVAPVDAIPIP